MDEWVGEFAPGHYIAVKKEGESEPDALGKCPPNRGNSRLSFAYHSPPSLGMRALNSVAEASVKVGDPKLKPLLE
jgi:hypothetical protein